MSPNQFWSVTHLALNARIDGVYQAYKRRKSPLDMVKKHLQFFMPARMG